MCVCVCVCSYRRTLYTSPHLSKVVEVANPLGRGVVVTITDTDQWQEMLHVIHEPYVEEMELKFNLPSQV